MEMTAIWKRDPGGCFESFLAAVHEQYEWERRAVVEHTNPPVVFSGKRGLARPTGVALPDYVGVLTGGRTVLMEAKTWEVKTRRRLRKRMHQALVLRKWAEYGVLAGYCVCWRWHGTLDVRWYPIESLAIEMDQKGEYVDFLREGGVVVEDFDWLRVAGG